MQILITDLLKRCTFPSISMFQNDLFQLKPSMALLIASESVLFNPTLIVLKVKGILFLRSVLNVNW